MRFRTEIELKPFEPKVDYSSRVVAFGSCFAQQIGAQLQRAKFHTLVNPFGALFNPVSIAQSIERIAANRSVSPDQIEQGSEGLFHYDFHSQLNGDERTEMAININQTIEQANRSLAQADWVILTLGTAWVYELKESGRVVANCHKQHPNLFERRRLSVDDVVGALAPLMEGALRGKRVVITLSPIRHLGDGLDGNSLSKATLRVAIEQLVSQFENVIYFPAYEIMVDDLRDYRFYGEDMTHPTPMAVEYIWELFCRAALSADAVETMAKVESIQRAVNHRARTPHSQSYRDFCRQQIEAIDKLNHLDFAAERAQFSDKIEQTL